jgi:hypothetical protein
VHRASAIGRRISAESIAQASRRGPAGQTGEAETKRRNHVAGRQVFPRRQFFPACRAKLHRRFTHLKDRFIKRARLFSCAGSMIEPCLGEDSEGQAH